MVDKQNPPVYGRQDAVTVLRACLGIAHPPSARNQLMSLFSAQLLWLRSFLGRLTLTILISSWMGAVSSKAQAAPRVDFARDIQPVLQARCYSCHGPKRQRSGLRLDVRAAALQGGDSGPVLVPGKSAASVLFHRISSHDAH